MRGPTDPAVTGRPARVLMTVDAVGGVWQYALELVPGLAAAGFETVLAVLGPSPDTEQRREAAALPGCRLIDTGLPLEWTAERADDVIAAGRAVAGLASRTGADIVHLNGPALAASTLFPAPVVAVAHSCVATWWRATKPGALPDDLAWRAALTRRGIDAADEVLAPSAAFATALGEVYGLPSPPTVVHNGRSPPPSIAAPASPAAHVFTAGRLWDEGKNLAAVDRAAARLSVPVLAAGALEGPNRATFRPRHLRPLGKLDEAEMRRQLAARPVFVSTARYEPFGLAVLEAAQAGCALVLSDIPTFRELWDGAALFVRATDDIGIADAVEALMRHPEARARWSDLAEQRAARYSVERMVEGVAATYRRLLASQAAGERREAAE